MRYVPLFPPPLILPIILTLIQPWRLSYGYFQPSRRWKEKRLRCAVPPFSPVINEVASRKKNSIPPSWPPSAPSAVFTRWRFSPSPKCALTY